MKKIEKQADMLLKRSMPKKALQERFKQDRGALVPAGRVFNDKKHKLISNKDAVRRELAFY